MGEYLSIFKLGQCNCKGFRIIYHYLNDDIYYIDYSATAFKQKWFKNSNKAGMVYIPIEALKKAYAVVFSGKKADQNKTFDTMEDAKSYYA